MADQDHDNEDYVNETEEEEMQAEIDEGDRWASGQNPRGNEEQDDDQGEDEEEEEEEEEFDEHGNKVVAPEGGNDEFILPYYNVNGIRQNKRLIPVQPKNFGKVENPLAGWCETEERLNDGMWHMSGDTSGGKRDEHGRLTGDVYELGVNMDTCDPRLHQAVMVLSTQDNHDRPALQVFNDYTKYNHLQIAKAAEIKKDIEKYGGEENVPKDFHGRKPLTPYFTIEYGSLVVRIKHEGHENLSIYRNLDIFRRSAEMMADGTYPSFFPAPRVVAPSKMKAAEKRELKQREEQGETAEERKARFMKMFPHYTGETRSREQADEDLKGQGIDEEERKTRIARMFPSYIGETIAFEGPAKEHEGSNEADVQKSKGKEVAKNVGGKKGNVEIEDVSTSDEEDDEEEDEEDSDEQLEWINSSDEQEGGDGEDDSDGEAGAGAASGSANVKAGVSMRGGALSMRQKSIVMDDDLEDQIINKISNTKLDEAIDSNSSSKSDIRGKVFNKISNDKLDEAIDSKPFSKSDIRSYSANSSTSTKLTPDSEMEDNKDSDEPRAIRQSTRIKEKAAAPQAEIPTKTTTKAKRKQKKAKPAKVEDLTTTLEKEKPDALKTPPLPTSSSAATSFPTPMTGNTITAAQNPTAPVPVSISNEEMEQLTEWVDGRNHLSRDELDELAEWTGIIVKRGTQNVFKGKARQLKKYGMALQALGFDRDGQKIGGAVVELQEPVKKRGEELGEDVVIGGEKIHIGFSDVRGGS